jgi:hypothetical protein
MPRLLPLAVLVVLVLLGGASAAAAAPGTPPAGIAAPHVLPARTATLAAAQPATWLVGSRVDARTRRIARRHGARLLSPRGTFVVPRARARALAASLRAAGRYRFAEPDRRLAPQQAPTGGDDLAATDWRPFLVEGLSAPPATGAPVTAIIDSAVDATHPDLAGVQVVGDAGVSDFHGTAVASMAGARGNAFGVVGIFPGAPLLSIGTPLRTASIVRSISRAVRDGARVINMSFGGPSPSFAMLVEIAFAISQDVLVVAAAGNDRFTVLPDGTVNPVMFPAAFPHVVSVSSMGPTGASSDFSTSNGAVDLAAPGEGVIAAVPVALDTDGNPDGFARLDGTSFAAPIVAGAAAWLLTERPRLRGAQAADLLRRTALDLPPEGWDTDSGYGLIDIGSALTAVEPAIDSTEVNDDIEWVDGRRFAQADGFLLRARERDSAVRALVDRWKDPADVYRFQIRGRSRLRLTLRTPAGADPSLAVFSSRGRSIYRTRGLVATSARRPGRTERAVVANTGRRTRVGYAVVYAPGRRARRIDAPYVLRIGRL